jgi:hypothetical protein
VEGVKVTLTMIVCNKNLRSWKKRDYEALIATDVIVLHMSSIDTGTNIAPCPLCRSDVQNLEGFECLLRGSASFVAI